MFHFRRNSGLWPITGARTLGHLHEQIDLQSDQL